MSYANTVKAKLNNRMKNRSEKREAEVKGLGHYKNLFQTSLMHENKETTSRQG